MSTASLLCSSLHMRRDRAIRTLACVASVLFVSCAEGETNPDLDASLTALRVDELPTYEVRVDTVIDGHAARLVPLGWAGFGPSGQFAITQPQDFSVLLFSASGRLTGRFGAEGSGPGEFRNLVRGGWVDDTLWLSDTELQRITYISPDANLLTSIPTPVEARDDQGTKYTVPTVYGISADTLLAEVREGAFSSAILWIDRQGNVHRRVLPVSYRNTSIPFQDQGRTLYLRVPFAGRTHFVVSPSSHRVVVATPLSDLSSFSIAAIEHTGDTAFNRLFHHRQNEIPRAVLDQEIRKQLDRVSGQNRREAARMIRAEVSHEYPAIQGLVVGSDERVWVQLYSSSGGILWVILGKDGDPEACLTLSDGTMLLAATENRLLLSSRDSVDVESVSIATYRLRNR